MFLFLPRSANAGYGVAGMPERAERLHRHEFGHSIQSLILGPFYLPCVGLPSLVWAGFPPVARMWKSGRRGYCSFVTERSADRLAERFSSRM